MRMLARSCPFNIRQLLWSSPRVTRLFSAAPSTVSIASQICQGCGCKLQPGDPASSGFVPSAVVAKIGSSCICKRCFRIKNYGARYQSPKIVDVLTSSNSKAFDGAGAVSTFLSSLRQAGVPVRVLLIVDPLDFSRGMWNQALGSAQALTSVPVDVCITKMDLLPHSADTQKIMESIAETIASDCEISQFTVSSNTQSGIKQVVQHVHQVLSKGISVMLVGFANAGKSSLANVLAGKLRRMVMPYDPQIASAALDAADAKPAVAEAIEFTVSKLPGTTMGIIPATLPGFQASSSLATVQLYDSPGMISDLTYVSLGARFCKNDLLANSICMSKRKKLRSLSVQNGQFIVIGRLCAIKVVSGKELLLAPHVSPTLEVELLSRGVQEKLHEFGCTLTPPLSAGDWQCRKLSFQGLGWKQVAGDIVIPGLGFVAVTGSGEVSVEVHAPSDIDIHARNSWIDATPLAIKWI